MKKLKIIFGIVFLSISAFAQLPSTDIYLLDMTLKDGVYTFGKSVNITHRPGYDNQPSFTADGKSILFSSRHDTSQTDIFMYTIRDSSTTQITSTSESEYSPVMLEDGKLISAVRVDKNGAQQLYYIDPADANQDNLVAPNEDSVAYYGWIDKNKVGITMLNGKETRLYIYDVKNYQYLILFQNTGRCMMKIPGTDEFSFTQKTSDSTYTIWRYNKSSNEDMLPLCDLPVHSEDYAFTPEGKLLSGKDGKLFMYDASTEKGEWKEIADFSETTGTFYRIAISPAGNKIALVGLGPPPKEKEKEKEKEKKKP